MPLEDLIKEHAKKISLRIQIQTIEYIKYSKDFKRSVKNLFIEKLKKLTERLKLYGRVIDNHMYFTVCMDGNEEAVHVFRVCRDRIKGILCYDSLNIEKLKRVKIRGKEYLICPHAKKVWNESDFEKYKADLCLLIISYMLLISCAS